MGSNAQRRREARAKVDEMRKAERARQRRNSTILTVVLAVVVAAAIVGVYLAVKAGNDSSTSASGDSANIPGVKTYGDLSRNHTTDDVDYPQTPPVGGDHDPQWLDCTGTVYDKPVRDENAVHSLEHGSVWITYNNDATNADIKSLASRVDGQPYTLMSPYPDQPGTIELTAWGKQLSVDDAADPRIDQFIEAYRQGPQTPEPGAPCEAGAMQ